MLLSIFVTELEGRIDKPKETSGQALDTNLCRHETPVGYNHDIAHDASIWAQTMRAEALKIGFEKLWNTKFAAIRVHARLPGQESNCELEHVLFSQSWKS